MPSTHTLHRVAQIHLFKPLRSGDAAALMIRPAVALDQLSITRLVHSERLNPHRLDWQNFIVAVVDGAVVGAVQMRAHADGGRELGSLVVSPAHRGHGLAGRLISALLTRHPGKVHVITGRQNTMHYAPWGFRTTAASDAPRGVRRHWLLGQTAGVLSLLRGRRPQRLVILQRD